MLVGLCGFAGSGKDATAALLRMRGFRRVAFADGVREEVVDCLTTRSSYLDPDMPKELWLDLHPSGNFGKKPVRVEDVWEKPTSPQMRRILQLWGTEFRRSQDPDYWVKRTMTSVRASLNYPYPGGGHVVLSDVRFPNEVRAVRAEGGKIWKIVRSGLKSDGHISESNIEAIVPNQTILNDGTLLDLAVKVLCLI